ncbi:MAG: homocysteine S-methyltransferase family protein [Candidatus Coproplasma sp.]
MSIKEKLKNSIIILDGGMGTQLQAAGLPLGTLPEEWNLTHPEKVIKVHTDYLKAGSNVICANTFGANCLKFGDRTEEVVAAAVQNAKSAAKDFKEAFVALDVGPTGRLLKPLGDLEFESAVEIFKRTIKSGVAAGADIIFVETMNDLYELKAAVLAAKECCDLPVFASVVFGRDCLTMSGGTPEAAVALLEGLGVDALGVNCSLAPAELTQVVERMLKASSTPIIIKPNAGLPEERDGKTTYSLSAEDFARDMRVLAEMGATVLGGCCGTTPRYILELTQKLNGVEFKKPTDKRLTVCSSYTHALYFGDTPVLIGERINPTGKKKLKEALRENDIAYILGEAVAQSENGAHALDVNVGLPEINEEEILPRCIEEIQAVTNLPLQIDTSSFKAMENAMRIYNGVAIINSVNGKKESMQAVFPLVKKYGGCVICLTLDETGIPSTAEGRIEIAKKIISVAKEYGIEKERLIFDTLAMAVSADPTAANAALDALKAIRYTLGCHTSLGVSNISFGLPQRDFINSTFFSMALTSGLSAAIYNPYSQEMNKTYKSFLALTGKDKNFEGYIAFANGQAQPAAQKAQTDKDLKYCVIKGLKDEAASAAEKLLATLSPMEVVNCEIIPALDEVGAGFENKTIFLPQLLMSAEAARAAFDKVKERLSSNENAKNTKIVLATVKGDIHDIGKNIVSTLLSNYGFKVYDLGKDVPPETVVAKVKEVGAQVVGLSALMTTTVVSMKETIELLKKECPSVLICVGGAVLNREYAEQIGADRYCKDAMQTVRFAEEVEGGLTK